MTKHSFITNEEELLSDIINNILPSTDALYFMVGYFYFSGYKKLNKNIGNKPVKILIGMDIDPSISKGLQEIYIASSIRGEESNESIREKVFENYIKMLNNIDDLDNEKSKKSFISFLEKIKNGQLEIRKTKKPNHAKMYLFQKTPEHNEGGNYPGVVITGSSNLSASGLSDRFEVNVILRDKNDYLSAKEIFNKLWDTSVEIVNQVNYDDFYKRVIKKTWIASLPKPILMYLRVLNEYFSIEKPRDLNYPDHLTDGKYFDFEYQRDAINKAIGTIQKHNGVIIADVVGLGKSIIASTVAKYFELKTVVIAPPHLKEQWERYVNEFNFNGKVYTSGKIEQAYNDFKDISKERLIIIDESHKYRNEGTKTYGFLHKLCAGNKVAILTATPFNNRPQDIFSLIKLFQLPAKSTIQTTESLSVTFKDLIIKDNKMKKESRETKVNPDKKKIDEIGRQIRNIIYPFIIRRTRLDLDAIPRYKNDLKKQNISFPKVNPPKLVSYDLGELTEIYEWTLEHIYPSDIKPKDYLKKKRGLIGARYKPIDYLKDHQKYKKQIEDEFGDYEMFVQGQRNIASFMRKMLVSRFESSIPAFKISINNMIRSYEEMIKWIDKFGLIPIYKKGGLPDVDDLEKEIEIDADALVQTELFQENLTRDLFVSKAREDKIKELEETGVWFIEHKEIKKSFKEGTESDIKIMKQIKEKWDNINNFEDKKLIEVKKHLKEKLKENPDRKIIIFSQFADTVKYIYQELKDEFKIMKYYSSLGATKLKEVVKNFDAGIDENEMLHSYDILVSTDAISEGYNLHRAGIVINYDIPYNPTRVIQRVGRINRINKKVFDELFIYNFFPTYIGENETRVKAISTLKIAIIHALLGDDTKVLTEDEELQSFFADEYKSKMKESEENSWDAKYIEILDEFMEKHPGLINKSMDIPLRTKIRRTVNHNKHGVLIFARKGFNYLFGFIDKEEQIHFLETNDALELFKADISEIPFEVSEKFDKKYQKLKTKMTKIESTTFLDKGEKEALDNVEYLIKNVEGRKPYLILLRDIIKELNALPECAMKEIRRVKLKNGLYDEVSKLSLEIPKEYLINLKERAKTIDDSVETVILSEELE